MSIPAQHIGIESPSVQRKYRTHVYKQQEHDVVNYRSMEHQKEKCKMKGNNISIVL
jgi:hypothetical protein